MFKISIFLFQLTRIFSQFTLQFPSSLSISLFVVSENIRSHCIAYLYSRLQKKYRAMLINFWTFFQGLCSLLQRVMNIFFSNIHYLMLWMMPILRTTLNIFAKCSRGYVYSRGFILESTVQIKLFC